MRTRLSLLLLLTALTVGTFEQEPKPMIPDPPKSSGTSYHEIVTLGGGCFWCLEAVFQELKGVVTVESGYSGGTVKNPTYREVCSGNTGHAEVVQITFDPSVISLKQLLEVFFVMHDPTTLNRQGADVGTQYRSVVFFRDSAQKAAAETVLREVETEKLYPRPPVTQIVPFQTFYKAEDYHQEYYAQHGDQPYCQLTISPKLRKLQAKFAALRKSTDGK